MDRANMPFKDEVPVPADAPIILNHERRLSASQPKQLLVGGLGFLDKPTHPTYIGPRKSDGLPSTGSAGSNHPVGGSSNGQREGEVVQ